MPRQAFFLTVLLVVGCLYNHVRCMEENPTPECGEDEYLSDIGKDGSRTCHPCQELTCEAGFEPNLSCGGGRKLTGAACIKCKDGYFSKAGEDCQGCSVCLNTVDDTPCTSDSDTVCGPCKEGYVYLGLHCRKCSQIPYPSNFEACREKNPPSDLEGDVDEKPVAYTVPQSGKMMAVEDNKGSDLPWNSLLVFIIVAGLILLVGVVIILIVIFFCTYKRNRSPAGSQQNNENDEQINDRQNAPVQRPNEGEDCIEVDALMGQDIQPTLRQPANSDHASCDIERETPLTQGNSDSSDGLPGTPSDNGNASLHSSNSLQDDTEACPNEYGDRKSNSTSRSHSPHQSPRSRFHSQDHGSGQLCGGCSYRRQTDGVNIDTAHTVYVYACGHHQQQQPNLKINPTFDPPS